MQKTGVFKKLSEENNVTKSEDDIVSNLAERTKKAINHAKISNPSMGKSYNTENSTKR